MLRSNAIHSFVVVVVGTIILVASDCSSFAPGGTFPAVVRSFVGKTNTEQHPPKATQLHHRHHARFSSRSALRMSIPTPIDVLSSGLASIVRLPRGVTVAGGTPPSDEKETTKEPARRPVSSKIQLKELYDIENNGPCRRVRERITELDLVVEYVIPSTPNSRVFTDPSYKFALPAGTTLPYLVVVNENGVEERLSGDDEILAYFDEKFDSAVTSTDITKSSDSFESTLESVKETVLPATQALTNLLASFFRIGRGSMVAPCAGKDRNDLPLILYSYEGNQFCRLVREVLTELDIPYELRSAGKNSVRRPELAEITNGSTQCPYLLDPRKDVAMSESKDIIRYLYQTYAKWTPPSEILQFASDNVMPLAKPLFAKLAPLQAGSAGDDTAKYTEEIAKAKNQIQQDISSNTIVVYTYEFSPFSTETKALLDSLKVDYKEISLGKEWLPGLIKDGGSQIRAALLEMTGQSSLPHIFIGGQSIGGLYSGTPGLLGLLEQDLLFDMITKANTNYGSSGLPGTPADSPDAFSRQRQQQS